MADPDIDLINAEERVFRWTQAYTHYVCMKCRQAEAGLDTTYARNKMKSTRLGAKNELQNLKSTLKNKC